MLDECRTCKFFMEFEDEEAEGLCRVNPPTIIPHKELSIAGHWPKISAVDWCGKHEPRIIYKEKFNEEIADQVTDQAISHQLSTNGRKNYPWKTMPIYSAETNEGWFEFNEGIDPASARSYAHQRGKDLGRKFEIKQGEDQFVGKLYCLRIE